MPSQQRPFRLLNMTDFVEAIADAAKQTGKVTPTRPDAYVRPLTRLPSTLQDRIELLMTTAVPINDHATPRKCSVCQQPAKWWVFAHISTTGQINPSSRVPRCDNHKDSNHNREGI
jgi:hypothetical protein